MSAALYYLFAYMFLTIGSFAVITVMARDGDTGHTITDYRGLARRQPVLALAFAVLLLGQAGVPVHHRASWPSSAWSGPSVATHAYALAAIAMVTGGRRRLLLPAGGGGHVLAGGGGGRPLDGDAAGRTGPAAAGPGTPAGAAADPPRRSARPTPSLTGLLGAHRRAADAEVGPSGAWCRCRS